MRFNTVESDILPLLNTYQNARSDDMFLYLLYAKSKGISDITAVFISRFIRYKRGIAPYETVSRVRRKLQEKYPELRPTPAQIEGKKKEVKDYKLYAKDKERLIKNDEQLA